MQVRMYICMYKCMRCFKGKLHKYIFESFHKHINLGPMYESTRRRRARLIKIIYRCAELNSQAHLYVCLSSNIFQSIAHLFRG